MIANGKKPYISYLNKLVDRYNIAYYHAINKKAIKASYSALTEKI